MPSQSKQQQKFFGLVRALQKGDVSPSSVSKKAKDVAKSMKKKDVKDFASTKRKGLPKKVKREQRVKNLIKKMVREELEQLNERCWKGYTQKGMKKMFGKMYPNCVKIKKKKTEGKLNEKVQKYVVGLDNGEVISGDKAVSEKKAHQIMTRISDRSDGWVNPFMIGVEAWNGTHPKSKGKPHKMNKKKIMVKEGTCGYGENGQLGEEPAGPHLIKKKKIKEKKLNEEKPYETILKQLGGNRFIAMTGAKNLGTNGKDLSFSIGRNAKRVTHVHIKLTSMDLYDVEFINMRGAKRKVIKKVKGVYGDMLPKIFQKYTGMRTRL